MEDKVVISMGADHAGYELKGVLAAQLQEAGYAIIDHGTFSADSVDYPDFVHPVADDVTAGNSRFGVIICGSANGVAMTANKHQGIRAAVCWTEEIAALGRQHNNANVIAIPARFVSVELAQKMTTIFLNTEFEGGRHERRVNKIACSAV